MKPVPGKLEIADQVLCQSVGEEVVLLNLATQQYYGLNSIGSRVWQLFLDGGDAESVCRALSEIYAVDPEVLKNDVAKLISRLTEAGLVKTPSL